VLHWRHLHENQFNLHRKQACVTNKHATELLQLHPHRTILGHKLYGTDHKARPKSVNCYPHRVHAGIMYNILILFNGNAWFHLNGHVNSHNNNSPMSIHEQPLHGVNVHVWFAMSASRIIGPIFFSETTNSH
jgi:hypothetical protein